MSGYRKRPDRLDNPGPLLGSLRTSRDAATRACADVKAFGVVYHGLCMVIVAIDALAVLLTGERDYFAVTGSTMPDGQRELEARKRAQEKGEL